MTKDKIKLIVAVGILSIVSLGACANVDTSADEGVPEGFTKVSETPINTPDIVEIRHNDTGCHYVVVEYIQSIAITPMYGIDGKPHCSAD